MDFLNLRFVRDDPTQINNFTVVAYNAADIANGGIHLKKTYPMNGILVGNEIGDVRGELVDPDNMDFRPQQNSRYIEDNVGPYKFQNVPTTYWIPGRRQYKVTF